MAKSLDELISEGVSGRRVLVRSDLNVPLDGTTVTDDGRVRASLPVLTKLTDAGARVIVMAHLGRPKGQVDPKYSIAPAAASVCPIIPFWLETGTRGSSSPKSRASARASIGSFSGVPVPWALT